MEKNDLRVTLSRADFCVICSTVEADAKSDIRERKINGVPVFLVIKELFGLKIDAADRVRKRLPHKLCSDCMTNLAEAHNLRTQAWKMRHKVNEWELNMEPAGKVIYEELSVKEEPGFNEGPYVKEEPPIEIKDEIIDESGEEIFRPEPNIEAMVSKTVIYKPDTVDLERPYGCPYCKLTFRTDKIAQLHQAVHQNAGKFRCKICGQTFKYGYNARKHIRMKHPKSLPDTLNSKMNVIKGRKVYARTGHSPYTTILKLE